MKSIVVTFAVLIFSFCLHAQTPEQKLNQLGIQLPQQPEAIGSYVDMVRIGNLVFLSGRGPLKADGKYITGKVGKEPKHPRGLPGRKTGGCKSTGNT